MCNGAKCFMCFVNFNYTAPVSEQGKLNVYLQYNLNYILTWFCAVMMHMMTCMCGLSECKWGENERERNYPLFLQPLSGSYPGTFCHHSPARSSGNGAPWPGLCALLSTQWKAPWERRPKHILTHASAIHLPRSTPGTDLSPLLNNMVYRNHNTD